MSRVRLKLSAWVREQGQGRCEYCRFPESVSELPFQIDHVIARKHGGVSVKENLAFACFYCNSAKIVRLFHPRCDDWDAHFHWEGARLCARTPEGRTTIQVLGINEPDAVAVREVLLEEGVRFD